MRAVVRIIDCQAHLEKNGALISDVYLDFNNEEWQHVCTWGPAPKSHSRQDDGEMAPKKTLIFGQLKENVLD